tara:strand:- start:118 stop:489 length:372 start_codon:yes stop_codon:yes gene_type:complete
MDRSRENSKYKTIGEVAQILDLYNEKNGSFSTHTIRFWEKEFKQIKPKIFSGNRRYYDDDSINILKKIKYLLKVKGMTLNGAKKVLDSKNSEVDDLINTSIKQKNIIKIKLKKIKKILKYFKN